MYVNNYAYIDRYKLREILYVCLKYYKYKKVWLYEQHMCFVHLTFKTFLPCSLKR